MLRRWIAYLLALLGALVLRVAYTGWLAGVVLWWVLALPVAGVLAALPALLSCKVLVTAPKEKVTRGSLWGVQLTGRSALGLPLGRVRARVEMANALTGERIQKTLTWLQPGGGGRLDIPAPSVHCGLYTARVVRAWGLDSLGLFWLPLRRGGPARLYALPRKAEGELPPLPPEGEGQLRPRPGGGPGEDYDPRPYRPGDPINTIHWKLSAKREELVVRETLENVPRQLLLTLDLFGTPGELDRRLDALSGLARGLLEAGRPFRLVTLDQVSGELTGWEIGNGEDWRACLEALLSTPAPPEGKSMLDLAGLEGAVHIGGGEGDG